MRRRKEGGERSIKRKNEKEETRTKTKAENKRCKKVNFTAI